MLCLHGFPDHARSFRLQLPAFAEAGFHAVAPTLRGYEPSSQPADGDYELLRMAEDVLGWLDSLGEQRCHLIGHDWGAVIGHLTAAMAPERFWSLTTIAVPHPGRLLREGLRTRPSQLRKSWYIGFFQLRGLADFALEAGDWRLIERLWRAWSPGFRLPEEELAALKDTFRRPGVKRAALEYYRTHVSELLLPSGRTTRRLLAQKIRVPTLAWTGAQDGCLDTRLYDDLMRERDFPAGLRVVRLPAAGHFLHQEAPAEFNAGTLDWLRQYGARRSTPASRRGSA